MVYRVRICFAAKLKEIKAIRKAKEEEKYRQELEQRLKREEANREEREQKKREKKELEEARERDRLERLKKYNEQKVLVKKKREELKQQAARDKKRGTNGGTSKLAGITRNEEGNTVRKTSLDVEDGVSYGLNGNEIDLKDPPGVVNMDNKTKDVKEQSINSDICSDKGNFTASIYGSNEEIHNASTKGVINGKAEQYVSKEEYGLNLEDDLKVSKIFMETQSLENIETFKSRTGNNGEMHERISLCRKEDKSMVIYERESADLRKNSSVKINERESVIVKDDGNEMSERKSGDLGDNRFECNEPERETTENEVTENENFKSVEVDQAENSFQVVSKGEDCDTPNYDDNVSAKDNDQFIDAFCDNDNANASTDSITHTDDGHPASNNATHVDTVGDNDIPDVSGGVSDYELLEFLYELYQEWKKTVTEKR